MKKYVFVGASQRVYNMFIKPMANQFSDYCELCGIYDINPGRAETVAKDFGLIVFNDFESMINETKPDYVLITTVDAYHSDYIIKSLQMGCDVITEKPMTIDAERCNAILKAEKETGHKVTVTFNYRYAPFMTKIKEIIHNGDLGDIFSVHFEWMLDRNMDVLAHGTSYFRRWNARMKNSGGLFVHKATHHFDLINWWINQNPVEVFAFADLKLYGTNGSEKYASGISGKNCRSCTHSKDCEFFYKLKDREIELFANNEKYDGYFKDGCVYASDIDIYDTMSATVRYDGGALLSYCLNATCAYEGWRVSINGSKGRLEAYMPETGPAKGDSDTIKVFDLNNNVTEYTIDKVIGDAHNGGDEKLRQNLFVGCETDPLGHFAGTRDGAYSIIIGAAANRSVKEKRPILISDILTEI